MTPHLDQTDLATIIRKTPDGMIVVDGEGITRFVNPAAEALFGMGADDLVGQLFGHPLGTGERTEIEIIRGYRELVQAEMNLAGIEWRGKPATLISLRDITARKEMEAALKESEADLREAKIAADAANRAKSEFLANMSHELRTPLNAILGYAQLLVRDETVSGENRDAAATIHKSGEHLLTLISDLLDIARIEAGKIVMESADFDFPAFLQGLMEPMAFRVKDKDVALTLAPTENLPARVRGDEKRLRQVLLNLLSNAVKFTQTGRVALSVRYADGAARFEVTDTGIGISEDALKTLFTPFEQGIDAQKGGEGAGLGLAISANLVRLMGGEIAVESAPGRGSAFRFEIPLERAAAPPGAAAASPANPFAAKTDPILGPDGQRLTALIVDDNALNRTVARGMMTRLKFDVIESEDGADAVQKVADSRPDVVLLDLVMPVMDGFAAAPEIRRAAGAKKTVIFAVSADVSRETRKRCAEIGCDDFIEKPIPFDGLAGTLRTHLTSPAPPGDPSPTPDRRMPDCRPGNIDALADMAAIGDVNGVRRLADRMKTSDPDRAGFYARLIDLAGGFRVGDIENLLAD